MNEPRPKTTVQHIRIDVKSHEVVRKVAQAETRSINDQYRKIVNDWVRKEAGE